MDAVIVAAGQGTRMRPLTDRRPKPLLPVGESTLLERAMEVSAPVVDRFVLVVGYRAEQVRETVGDDYGGKPVEYVEQTEQLGTAHAIEQVADVVQDRFLVLNGDVVVEPELPRQLAEVGGNAIAVRTVEDPTSYGVVDVEDGRVTGLVEKPDDPPSNLINTGLYAFEPEIFEYVERTPESERGEYEVTDSIELLLEDGGEVAAVEYEDTWLDVGRPWELLEANEVALAELEAEERATAAGPGTASDVRRVAGEVEPGAELHGAVVVADGARVRSGAYVEGPAVIREGADVGPNAYVRGATVIGPGVRVGNAVEVKNSVLLADAAVGHLSYVGDSVLGADVNFGAGTKVANLRHDDESVRLTVKGERVDTGRRKFGVVVGDGAKTGINTSLNAGVTLGTEATTGLGEAVTRDRGREDQD